MPENMNDPIGSAIFDFYTNGETDSITIQTNYTEDETLDPSYFFRMEKDLPHIERRALDLCKGDVLDVGAGAGSHSLILQNRGLNVSALEVSLPASEVIRNRGVRKVFCTDVYDFAGERFDTILMLMNGTGIGGTIEGLKKLLLHLKTLLKEGGQILIDSSDIQYLFEEDDGSVWIDLTNDAYYGEMEYSATYKDLQVDFDWLFVDYSTLQTIAESAGYACTLIVEGQHDDYLARLNV